MKKLYLCIFLSLLFFSCSDYFFEHDFRIENNSSLTVSFAIKNYGDEVFTLAPDEVLVKKLYDNPQLLFENYPRVYFAAGVKSGEIKNMEKHEITVTNSCEYEVTLEEENNLLGDNFGDTYVLPPDSETKIILYTENPKYKATYTKDDVAYNAISYLMFIP